VPPPQLSFGLPFAEAPQAKQPPLDAPRRSRYNQFGSGVPCIRAPTGSGWQCYGQAGQLRDDVKLGQPRERSAGARVLLCAGRRTNTATGTIYGAVSGCGAIVIKYRQASAEDLPAIARLFVVSFADSMHHVGVGAKAAKAIADAFGLALSAEPEGLIVAEVGSEVVGYGLATGDAKRMRRKAFWQGQWPRMLWRLLTGRYGIGWRTVRAVCTDKAAFLRGARLHGGHQARPLSLAVHPAHRGQGIGRELFAASLEYLRICGAQTIRLEVRPDNVPARSLYESFGFCVRGRYEDSQGEWLVMTCRAESPG